MKATENTESTEKDPLSHAVIGAALEVHRLLGPGLLESIYEEALCHEFRLRGLEFERQKPVDVIYKDVVIKGQRLDLIIERALIVEIKCVSTLPEVALAQVLSYLRATGLRKANVFLCELCVLCGFMIRRSMRVAVRRHLLLQWLCGNGRRSAGG